MTPDKDTPFAQGRYDAVQGRSPKSSSFYEQVADQELYKDGYEDGLSERQGKEHRITPTPKRGTS